MRRSFMLAFAAAIVCSQATRAQLVNGGFEMWTGQVPDGWSTNNIEALDAVVITQSQDARSGAFAVRGEAIANPIVPNEIYPPVLQNLGVPISQAPTSFSGWYKFAPSVATSSLLLSINVTDADGQLTGSGYQQITSAASSYTSFNIPVDYTNGSGDPSTHVTVAALLVNSTGTEGVGSTYHLDDLSISGVITGIDEVSAGFNVGKPYPQPATVTSTMEIQIDMDQRISASVIDVTGREVERFFDREMPAGIHRIIWKPSAEIADGKYIARFVGEAGTMTIPIILLR